MVRVTWIAWRWLVAGLGAAAVLAVLAGEHDRRMAAYLNLLAELDMDDTHRAQAWRTT